VSAVFADVSAEVRKASLTTSLGLAGMFVTTISSTR
jgi:hypothetical protein